MHTTKIGKTSFIHNGDPFEEGSIVTVVANRTNAQGGEVPMDDLMGFIGESIKDMVIRELEEADPMDFVLGAIQKRLKDLQ